MPSSMASASLRLAEQAFISELARLVTHLTERLTDTENGERKIFRDSATTNLSEFFDRLKQLNVRSNADLDQPIEQAGVLHLLPSAVTIPL